LTSNEKVCIREELTPITILFLTKEEINLVFGVEALGVAARLDQLHGKSDANKKIRQEAIDLIMNKEQPRNPNHPNTPST
jgi:hypothetical protein